MGPTVAFWAAGDCWEIDRSHNTYCHKRPSDQLWQDGLPSQLDPAWVERAFQRAGFSPLSRYTPINSVGVSLRRLR